MKLFKTTLANFHFKVERLIAEKGVITLDDIRTSSRLSDELIESGLKLLIRYEFIQFVPGNPTKIQRGFFYKN